MKIENTRECGNTIHELGHLIFYILFILNRYKYKHNSLKTIFCNNFKEISIIPIPEENSSGRIIISNNRYFKNLYFKFVYLSGVLLELYMTDSEYITKFEKIEDIKRNFFSIYQDNYGYSDISKVNSIYTDKNISVCIYELSRKIYKLWNMNIIRNITEKLYNKLQKDKIISSLDVYKIIEPYISELKILGDNVYGLKTKLSIYAKIILF